MTRWTMTVLAAGVLAGGAWASDKLPVDQLPAKVQEAVKAKYPQATIVSAEKDTEAGKPVFEVALKDGEKSLEAKFDAEGVLVSTGEAIKFEDLPAKVQEAFKKAHAKVEITKVEKETYGEGEKAKVVYEITWKDGTDQDDAEYDADGNVIAD